MVLTAQSISSSLSGKAFVVPGSNGLNLDDANKSLDALTRGGNLQPGVSNIVDILRKNDGAPVDILRTVKVHFWVRSLSSR
jgi:hypothetical protein